MNENYIAHINLNKENPIQTLKEHSTNVAEMCKEFATKFGCGEVAYTMGLLHDDGKRTEAFQNHIKCASGYDTTCPDTKDPNGHAYIGAVEAFNIFKGKSGLIFNPIASHHTGLYNKSGVVDKIKTPLPYDFESLKDVEDFNYPSYIDSLNKDMVKFHHLQRMLYSCLVDADFLDTEKFMNSASYEYRKQPKDTMEELLEKVNKHIENLRKSPNQSPINYLRNQILDKCIADAKEPFTLSKLVVPTGAGKTLDSIAWALNHAVKYGKDRIIISIPYISIASQTASEYKKIFGEKNVLEVQSSFDFDSIKNEELKNNFRLSSENFDAPIVITTNVQFIESMFSNKPSKCRKLHNYCNSVVILDEIQKLPSQYLQPTIDAFKVYNELFKTDFLFMSATELPLDNKTVLNGLDNVHEIITKDWNLEDKLKRTNIIIEKEPLTYDELADRICKEESSLTVVFKRDYAKEIYNRVKAKSEDGTVFHLSRNMCTAHIQNTIDIIKSRLKDGLPIKLISTNLIEAGVDVDFPCVFKQADALDSIIQAAGRGNREGKRDNANVYVFDLKNMASTYGTEGNSKFSAYKDVKHHEDVSKRFVIEAYFNRFLSYLRTSGTDTKKINESAKNLNYEDVNRDFCLIEDNNTVNVFVPYKEGKSLIDSLNKYGPSIRLMRKLGRYIVSISNKKFEDMVGSGMITFYGEDSDGIPVLSSDTYYDEKMGIITESNEPMLII